MALKVIGAGFGRTGTMSLKIALEELGFEKCYHMVEAIENPHHLKFWYDASLGQVGNWDEIFDGFQATVDWPGCAFYKELFAYYPDAKVILTVRDPERWYESVDTTIFVSSHIYPWWMVQLVPKLRYNFQTDEQLIWQNTFQGRFTDKEHAIRVFHEHIEEVQRTVPSEKLLIYDVREGWEPLCRFLGVPIPQDKSFPHSNDKATFQEIVKRRRRIVMMVYATLFGILALLVGWWFV